MVVNGHIAFPNAASPSVIATPLRAVRRDDALSKIGNVGSGGLDGLDGESVLFMMLSAVTF
jgi:hypothetical protein